MPSPATVKPTISSMIDSSVTRKESFIVPPQCSCLLRNGVRLASRRLRAGGADGGNHSRRALLDYPIRAIQVCNMKFGRDEKLDGSRAEAYGHQGRDNAS